MPAPRFSNFKPIIRSGQLAEAIDAVGASVPEFADFLMTDRRTVYRWLEGGLVPHAVSRLLQTMIVMGVSLKDTQEMIETGTKWSRRKIPATVVAGYEVWEDPPEKAA